MSKKQKPNKLHETSSLQKYFICNGCNKKFVFKAALVNHVAKQICPGMKRVVDLKCVWCGLNFHNRGGLTNHTKHMHGKQSLQHIYDQQSKVYKCDVCETSFCSQWSLRQHIRRQHFNLQARVPYCELKKVNQVWFEKCLNTDTILEIKKTGHSSLIMRRLNPSTSIKVNDSKTKTIDLSRIYPVNQKKTIIVICEVCEKSIVKKEYKKHLLEKHTDMKKIHCNNCNKSFKRSYQYIRHVCNKKRNRRYRFCNQPVEILNVTSMDVINVS